MTTNARHDTRHDTDRRVPVVEAAKLLDLTPDAIRARLRRGTLQKETGPDGETLVVLDADTTARSETGRSTEQTTVHYINALKSHIDSLERELEDRKEEGRRKDHLLAAALERIPSIEAPESSETAADGGGGDPIPPEPDPPQRSFWAKLFGLQ